MNKSLKERIQALEGQNHLLDGSLADTLWVLDSETLNYEYVTSSVYKNSGYTAEELVNTMVSERFTEKSAKKATAVLRAEIREYAKGKHVLQSIEVELNHKNGGTYWIELKAKLVEDFDGSLKIIGLSREITTRKRAEQLLDWKNAELSRALAEKEKLLKEIKMLQELLPICSGCKRIRDDNGKWWPLEIYIAKHTDSSFTHTICRDCKPLIYPELEG
ncbi:MAG: PAS domain S-box protein [Pseudomonadota bacterium]